MNSLKSKIEQAIKREGIDLLGFASKSRFEGVPAQNNPFSIFPEGNGLREPVADGKVPSDVVCSVRLIAAGCGLGEIGYSKVFLTRKFGPRVRLGLIFTDAVLEPDPIMETGEICLHCGACVRECPGNAVPPLKEKEKRLEVDFGEKKVWYGDV